MIDSILLFNIDNLFACSTCGVLSVLVILLILFSGKMIQSMTLFTLSIFLIFDPFLCFFAHVSTKARFSRNFDTFLVI